MNPLTEWLLLAAVPRLGYAYIRLLHATMRLEYRGREHLEAARGASGRYVLAFWHSRFLMMPYAYPGDRITVLSGRHRDSEMLARILVRFGIDLSKGSSTEGAVGGLKAIVQKVRLGYDVGFTPDGPRGPRRRVKSGVIAAARLARIPIVPAAFSASPARRLRSWDRTLVPRPWSRGIYAYGSPIHLARDASPAEQERARLAVEQELDRLTDSLDAETGIGAEDPRPPAGTP